MYMIYSLSVRIHQLQSDIQNIYFVKSGTRRMVQKVNECHKDYNQTLALWKAGHISIKEARKMIVPTLDRAIFLKDPIVTTWVDMLFCSN